MNTRSTQIQIQQTVIELVAGDLTELDVDAIVNAANRELVLGGGVAGAIRAKGGPAIQAECDALAPIPTGEAVMTGAGRLKARHVIHAVGPRYGNGRGDGDPDPDELLAQATRRSLALAEEAGLSSLAFPAISTGVYGFPIDRCAEIMLGTALAYVAPGSHLERITFCLFGDEALQVFERSLGELVPAAGTQVRVRFFAATREAAGQEEATLPIAAGATAGQALAELVRRYPALAGHAQSLRLAVNLTYVEPAHVLGDGDELALIPPTCGG